MRRTISASLEAPTLKSPSVHKDHPVVAISYQVICGGFVGQFYSLSAGSGAACLQVVQCFLDSDLVIGRGRWQHQSCAPAYTTMAFGLFAQLVNEFVQAFLTSGSLF